MSEPWWTGDPQSLEQIVGMLAAAAVNAGETAGSGCPLCGASRVPSVAEDSSWSQVQEVQVVREDR